MLVKTFTTSSATQVAYGEHLRVVGSHAALGGWKVAAAPELHWTPGNVWTAKLELPAGAHFEYKFVHVMPHSPPVWEATPNRSLTVPTARQAAVNADWNLFSSGAAELEVGAIEIQAPEARAFLEALELPVAFEQSLEGDSCPILEYMESSSTSPAAEAAGPKQAEAMPLPQSSAAEPLPGAATAAAADTNGKPSSSPAAAAVAAAAMPANTARAAVAAPTLSMPEKAGKPALATASLSAQLVSSSILAEVPLVPALAPAKPIAEGGNDAAAAFKAIAEHAKAILTGPTHVKPFSAAVTALQAAEVEKPASLAVIAVAEPATAKPAAAGEKAASPTVSGTPASKDVPTATSVSARTSPLRGGEGAVAQAERRRKAQGESRRRATTADGGAAHKARKASSSSGASKQARRKR
ncbi:hypothetical protein N2152v2_005700 [Parachlorella kessleri]